MNKSNATDTISFMQVHLKNAIAADAPSVEKYQQCIEVLQKQVPQTAVHNGRDNIDCPNCGTSLGHSHDLAYFGYPHYCEHCGQALLWGSGDDDN